MTDIVICEPDPHPCGPLRRRARLPVRRRPGRHRPSTELVRRTGLQEGDVDDVVLGQCYPSGETPAIGRIAALDAGLGTGVPGLQLDRRCGSGLQAVLYAAGAVATGRGQARRRRRRRVDVATSSTTPSGCAPASSGGRRRADGPPGPGPRDRRRQAPPGARRHARDGREPAPGVRHLARGAGRARRCARQQRAGAAHEAGRFADELVPVTVPGRRGKPDVVVDRDEHPAPGDDPRATSPPCGRCV